ncbi:MAG: hypothetical protein IRZ16_13335 [Myxococcaceae bacterium]|nr:hypothetical protein [Myxococcaceae bacterium]
MEDVSAIDYRTLFASPLRKDRRADLEPALEAFSFAWRPAGSMSLAERWLRAGESTQDRSPPRPPAPPSELKLKRRRIKR